MGSYGHRWSLWSTIWTNRVEAAGLLPTLILKACASASTTCCRGSGRTRLPRVTLIQCCWPFRAWRRIEGVPLGQFHSNSHHLAEHLCLLRVTQDPYWDRRQRMRLQDHFLAAHAAPAAGMPIAGFHKIDRPFIFRAPRTFHYFASRLIDLDETAWRQNGIHREILRADVAISEIRIRKLRQICDRHRSPLLNHTAQIGGAPLVKTRIHAHRNLHRRQSRQSARDMRFRRRNQTEVRSHIVQVDSIPRHELAKVATVNYRQSIKAVNAG